MFYRGILDMPFQTIYRYTFQVFTFFICILLQYFKTFLWNITEVKEDIREIKSITVLFITMYIFFNSIDLAISS